MQFEGEAMSIRIRTTENGVVALCAAKTDAHPDDLYLGDAAHHALYEKFVVDFESEGIINSQLQAQLDKANEKNKRLREELEEAKRRQSIPVQGFVK